MTLALLLLAAAALTADTLRRIYAVGREANDHFVAVVVLGCGGFYGLMMVAGQRAGLAWAPPLFAAGVVGLWGLFFAIHRRSAPPPWAWWLFAFPSQVAYAFALWGGLFWLIRAPLALLVGWPLLWPGAWLFPPLALTMAGLINNYGWANRVRRHRVEGLPLRIAQLSDLHASPLMHRRELMGLVETVNALAPDLVVITGDLVMPFSEAEHGYLLDALAALEAPALACPGNHDLPILETLRAELAARGVPLLVDERITLRAGGVAVEVVGAQFRWRAAREGLEAALAALPPAEAAWRVLLAHDPRLGAWVPPGRFDLVLSGHTHGGQVAANMFGLQVSLLRAFGVRDQGWWEAGGAAHYVHRGNWVTGFPPRMGVAPEVALFEGR